MWHIMKASGVKNGNITGPCNGPVSPQTEAQNTTAKLRIHVLGSHGVARGKGGMMEKKLEHPLKEQPWGD
jgi:hypothetical protein